MLFQTPAFAYIRSVVISSLGEIIDARRQTWIFLPANLLVSVTATCPSGFAFEAALTAASALLAALKSADLAAAGCKKEIQHMRPRIHLFRVAFHASDALQ